MMRKAISILATAILAVSLVTLSSCEDEQITFGNVLVVHASPDAPGVDLLIDDAKVNTQPLTYPGNTGYLEANQACGISRLMLQEPLTQ